MLYQLPEFLDGGKGHGRKLFLDRTDESLVHRLRFHALHVYAPVVEHLVGVDSGDDIVGGRKQFPQKVHQEDFFLQDAPALVLGIQRGLFGLAVKDGGLGVFQAGGNQTLVVLDFLLQVGEPFFVELATGGAVIVVGQQRPEGVIDLFVIAVPHAAVEGPVLQGVVAMV